MSYEVRVSRDAARYLERLDPTTRRRVLRRLEALMADPLGQGSEALVGRGGLRSSRVGDYRIIFAVDLEAAVINAHPVGPGGAG